METVARQQQELGAIFDLLITELAKHNIILINEKQLKDSHISFVKQYFDEKIKPVMEPIMIHDSKEPPFLHNKHLYFALELKPKKARSDNPEILEHAIAEIPTDHLDRFLLLPKLRNKHYVIFLDDVLQYSMHLIFPKHDVLSSYSIKLSRDADLYMDDKLAGDLVKNIKKSLEKRSKGIPSRFLYDVAMPKPFLKFHYRNMRYQALYIRHIAHHVYIHQQKNILQRPD